MNCGRSRFLLPNLEIAASKIKRNALLLKILSSACIFVGYSRKRDSLTSLTKAKEQLQLLSCRYPQGPGRVNVFDLGVKLLPWPAWLHKEHLLMLICRSSSASDRRPHSVPSMLRPTHSRRHRQFIFSSQPNPLCSVSSHSAYLPRLHLFLRNVELVTEALMRVVSQRDGHWWHTAVCTPSFSLLRCS